VQLYEAVLLLTLVWIVRRNEKRWRGSPGRTASAMVIGYAVLRFLTEFLRADNRLVLSALTMPQVLSLLVGATVSAALCAGRARERA
jgi:prolipoprotein diacylglyceryltransferase